jgi:uncharacterized protein DUF72
VASFGPIRIGMSAFIATRWEGTFYPAGMKPADFLSYYATKFDAVEVDSTFYRVPTLSTVKGWYGSKDRLLFVGCAGLLTTQAEVIPQQEGVAGRCETVIGGPDVLG